MVHGERGPAGPGGAAGAAVPERRRRRGSTALRRSGRGGAPAKDSGQTSAGKSAGPAGHPACKRTERRILRCRQAGDAGGGHRAAVSSPGAGPPACRVPCRLRWGLASGERHRMRRAGDGDQRLLRGLASHPRRGLPAGVRDRQSSVGRPAGRPRHRTGDTALGRGGDKGLGTGERSATRPAGAHLSPGAGHRALRRLLLHLHRGRGSAGIPGHPRTGRRLVRPQLRRIVANLRSCLRHRNVVDGRGRAHPRPAERRRPYRTGRRGGPGPAVGRGRAMGLRRQPDSNPHGGQHAGDAIAHHQVPPDEHSPGTAGSVRGNRLPRLPGLPVRAGKAGRLAVGDAAGG